MTNVQGVIGMLRGIETMLLEEKENSEDNFKEPDLRKLKSKMASLMSLVDGKMEKLAKAPKV